jgi:hypothetical protein
MGGRGQDVRGQGREEPLSKSHCSPNVQKLQTYKWAKEAKGERNALTRSIAPKKCTNKYMKMIRGQNGRGQGQE